MKITAARIRNFKLLRKIDLSFSIDRDNPLTIIRAENGSGKTSTLHALRWAFYGKSVLDDPYVRLSPADWPDNKPCEISVEIDFIDTKVSIVKGNTVTSEMKYMLKREVEEQPVGDSPNRGRERVVLYEKAQDGAEPVNEGRIEEMLPREMIEIFFTDGDKAMTFISPHPDEGDKVKEAIQSLLGLDLLEQVEKRLSDIQTEVNRNIAKTASSKRLVEVIENIEKTKERRDLLLKKVEDLQKQIKNTREKRDKIRKELHQALESGSYEELANQLKDYSEQLKKATDDENNLKRSHQGLFEDESLSLGLLEPILRKGYEHLTATNKKNIIPRATVPVLEERLDLGECICGTDLSEGTPSRDKVIKLIREQQESDSDDYLPSLYHKAKQKLESLHTEDWLDSVEKLTEQRLSVKKRIEYLQDRVNSVKNKLSGINEEEIKQKLAQEEMYDVSLENNSNSLGRVEVSLADEEEKLRELSLEQKELSRADDRLRNLNAEKTALTDLQEVISGTLREIQGDYLNRVSSRMNEMFLTMVGADPDPEQNIFQGAEINNEHSIVVKTKDGRTLNPDYEVSGAYQRALTFAFVWALTEVSGVVAPRIIDTPLGMMSGNVKRRVLEMISRAAEEDVDRQVILFLTQSEISHTEDILDKRSGRTFTLFKTDDYPVDLVNDPGAEQPEVRLCDCTHREYCEQCERKNREEFQLIYREN